MPVLTRPDGIRLYHEVHGQGEPLLLLEGLGGDIPGWRRNIPRLAEELLVVARGCVTRGCARHYLGFAANQWHLFEQETPRRVKPQRFPGCRGRRLCRS